MKLRTLRKSLKMTQDEVADKLEVSQPQVSWWECGKFIPNISSIEAINRAFYNEMKYYRMEAFSRLDFY